MPLPFAHRVNRVTIYGSSYGGQEIWTTGFYMGNVDSDASNPSEASAVAIKAAWKTLFESVGATIGYLWKTEGVKIAPMLANGDTDKDFVVTSPYTTAISGQHSGTGFPAQISLVATLLAGNGRGLAGKGRMYIPGVATGIDSTGHLAPGYNSTLANLLKTFFDAVNSSADVPGTLINASHGRKVTTVPGGDVHYINQINRSVSHMRVGNVYDTQRRRRNSLVEAYATSQLA